MVRTKDELERAEANWDRKAQAESIRCVVCNHHIAYDEREVYFRTKMCGACDREATKDD